MDNFLVKTLTEKINNKTSRIGIIGLGYVGVPLAQRFLEAGFEVIGFDIDEERVKALTSGKRCFTHIDPKPIKKFVADEKFKIYMDENNLPYCDVILICVPTPLTASRDPDMQYIEEACFDIARNLRRGQLIILESTTYPGTTENLVVKILENNGGDFKAGEDFFVAFSPEREDPGNKNFNLKNTPKVIGGLTPCCAALAGALYGTIVDSTVVMSSCAAAEMTKILENTYRAVNIALVNELKIVCHRLNIDIWEVIKAASTKPYGFAPFYPGLGSGGHCLVGSQYVCVRRSREVGARLERFRDLFKQEKDIYGSTKHHNIEHVFPEELETLSYDTFANTLVWKPVQELTRRCGDHAVFRFSTKLNYTILATDMHPMLVADPSKYRLSTAWAKDVAIDSYLPSFLGWPESSDWHYELDLLELAVKHKVPSVRIGLVSGSWADYKEVLAPLIRIRGLGYRDFVGHNDTLRLCDFVALRDKLPHDIDVFLTTGVGAARKKYLRKMVIDEDFARLIGYYLSEGCITVDESTRVRFSFGVHESELINDALYILEKFGMEYSIYKSKIDKGLCIKVSSNLWGKLIRDELKCGTRSENVAIPDFVFTAPDGIRKNVLKGFLRGDGSIYFKAGKIKYIRNGKMYNHNASNCNASGFSASRYLTQQLLFIARSIGYIPSMTKNNKQLNFFGMQAYSISELFEERKRIRAEQYFSAKKKIMSPRNYIDFDTYTACPVKEKSLTRKSVVYSMEVADTHTFVTSYGLIVHNCISLDPHYLSYRARQVETPTRFIDVAGEINWEMPRYVARRVQDALNDRGRSVKGAMILALGVAYKKNIGDIRESPALKMLEELKRLGATVNYYDPFVKANLPMTHVVGLSKEGLENIDCVVLAVDHDGVDYPMIFEHARLIVDTKNVFPRSEKVVPA